MKNLKCLCTTHWSLFVDRKSGDERVKCRKCLKEVDSNRALIFLGEVED